MESKPLSLNWNDLKSRGVNIILFLSPVIILILTQLQNSQTVDRNLVYVTGIGLVLNLLKKFIQTKSI